MYQMRVQKCMKYLDSGPMKIIWAPDPNISGVQIFRDTPLENNQTCCESPSYKKIRGFVSSVWCHFMEMARIRVSKIWALAHVTPSGIKSPHKGLPESDPFLRMPKLCPQTTATSVPLVQLVSHVAVSSCWQDGIPDPTVNQLWDQPFCPLLSFSKVKNKYCSGKGV